MSQSIRKSIVADIRKLTYMSIHEEIAYWCDSSHQELFLIGPTLGGALVRFLYGTREINRLIEGPWADE
jgi:hypothetical protein